MEKKLFGKVEGKDVFLYTFTNKNGLKFSITNFGGIVTNLFIPDKKGKTEDVVLGFDDLEGYLGPHPFFGALIGRFGNRIAKGVFELNGKKYTLAVNNGPNHLHGGNKGFDKVIWEVKDILEGEENGIILEYLSKDGEEGYPGNLVTSVKCSLNNNNELVFEYSAKTDEITVVNLTHHGYFNLNGCKHDVTDHTMEINADTLTAIDDTSIPTGEYMKVSGTAFDFLQPRKIGEKIEEAGGYDHNYVLNKQNNELSFAARVTDPESGRMMEVYTTEPGIQFYSGIWLDGSEGKKGVKYHKYYGLCLETQHYPDSPNKPGFPATILKPGETYKQITKYIFSAR